MVCKFHEVLEFVREFKLLDDLDDAAVQEIFDIFPHCCSWDKQIRTYQFDCDELDVAVDKTMEVLDDAYDHAYTWDQVKEVAKAFCGVFETAGAPKRPVPFVIVLLARL